MLKTILIGLDRSAFARSATTFALRWAKQTDALLVGLAVVDEPGITAPAAQPLGAGEAKRHRDATLLADARREGTQALETIALECAREGVAFKPLEATGTPHEEIATAAQRFDVILLGCQTFFRHETQSQPDDTLELVLKHGPRPVIAVPERHARNESIVIAYDGSLPAARTLQSFQESGLGAGKPIHVVSILPDSVQAAKLADRAIEYLRFHDLAAQAHAIGTSTPPHEVLLEQLQHLRADLLVMGVYGKAFWHDFFFGSVTRSMLARCPVPMFLYH